jgi:uncharacterized protein (TIGR03382 family)
MAGSTEQPPSPFARWASHPSVIALALGLALVLVASARRRVLATADPS